MSEEKKMRLSLAAKKVGVSVNRAAEYLSSKGFEIDSNPNSKISNEQFGLLMKEFEESALENEEAKQITIGKKPENIVIKAENIKEESNVDDDIFISSITKKVENKTTITETNITKEKTEEKVEEKPKVEPIKEEVKPVEKVIETKSTEEATEKNKTAEPKELEPIVSNEIVSKDTPKEEEKVKDEEAEKKGLKVLGKIDLNQFESKNTKQNKGTDKSNQTKDKNSSKKEDKKVTAEKQNNSSNDKNSTKSKFEDKKPSKDNSNKNKNTETNEKVFPKVDKTKIVEEVKTEVVKEVPKEVIEAKADTLKGLTVLGKIELPTANDKKKDGHHKGPHNKNKPNGNNSNSDANKEKKKRKRIKTNPNGPVKNFNEFDKKGPNKGGNNKGGNNRGPVKEEITDKEIQDKIKATLAKLSGNKSNSNRSKYKKDRRSANAEAEEQRLQKEQKESKVLKVTEFISANDMAQLMSVSVNDVIKFCLGMGMFISINQRLDAEALTLIGAEFGYDVKFISADEELNNEEVVEEVDAEEDLEHRAPIVTIMGHVDHGKTSLLDHIRKTRVAAGEAGGITQHIGAYSVKTDSGKNITFLDTPGHEAFTAMRARGAKLTDIVIIVVAADDNVMPQTKEAINHAMVAGVPIVIAINKIDKPAANPDKIKEELAQENILVEDWGGKYQCEHISAKQGTGISELLEKVLLEAEILDLKANPNKKANGTVIEASLDKGRGYVASIMIQAGTLNIGDIILAGAHFGRVRAMFDYNGKKVAKAGPATPVQILGLNGAPQAGDTIQVMESERDAREIATKREQLIREQSIRTKKHITLDEIGRRLAIGNFKELNIIVKGDVDGSVEALSDSLLKLSTEEIQVRIIHKGVGGISESDVLLASASDAIIVGFNVRASQSAKKIAENEQIEIRHYSIIYDAINDVKDAMEGLLEPKTEEVVVGTVEVRATFKISKVGTIAGCYVTDGIIKRNNQVRVIRDGIVRHTGKLESLKHLKDDKNEIRNGYECGLNVQGYNDIEEGDIIESFETKEVKRKL